MGRATNAGFATSTDQQVIATVAMGPVSAVTVIATRDGRCFLEEG
jgi:hypothetical protein